MDLTGRQKSQAETAKHRTQGGGEGGLNGLSALSLGVFMGLAIAMLDRSNLVQRLVSGRWGDRHAEAAQSPAEISGLGWRRILMRTWREFTGDRIPAVAAGATFYALLALFPAVSAFVSLYGLFSNVEDARREVMALAGVLPEGGVKVLSDEMLRLATSPHAGLGATFVASLVVSLWSATSGVKSIIAGLNIAYEESEKRSFIRLNLVSLGFTISAIMFALMTAAAVAAAPRTLQRLDLGALDGAGVLRWPALLLIALGGLALLYRYGPSRAHARWRWVTPGSLLAAVAWILMSVAFSVYVGNFGHFNRTYGSLGAMVGFLVWIWLSLIVTLVGAEINSEIEQQTTVDTTTGPPRAVGRRGAAVSDRRGQLAKP